MRLQSQQRIERHDARETERQHRRRVCRPGLLGRSHAGRDIARAFDGTQHRMQPRAPPRIDARHVTTQRFRHRGERGKQREHLDPAKNHSWEQDTKRDVKKSQTSARGVPRPAPETVYWEHFMMERTLLLVRRTAYTLRGGFLVRPLAIALTLGLVGASLSWLEQTTPEIASWVPRMLFPSHSDPQLAQVILGGIAASIMTVVSIVFAILLMTLTLASMQFSPRIIVSFVRDRVVQWTLGVFLGTFCYCMAALPAARNVPHPFSPVATVTGALVLALVCVAWLLFFIHHISQAISVNHIVDRIAGETEDVIDQIMPHPRSSAADWHPHPETHNQGRETPLTVTTSGYVRFIDLPALLARAKSRRVRVRLTRRIGQFVPAGFPFFMVTNVRELLPEDLEALRAAIDIGPTRTLQQDAEFGVLQIVDIALRAISPAVNDPSTAINCIDQLSRILIRWVSRDPPKCYLSSPPHVVRLEVRWITTDELLDTAFEQIRHYSQSDVAVSLRLLRALTDIAGASPDRGFCVQLGERGRRIVHGASLSLRTEDIARLNARLHDLESECRDKRANVEATTRTPPPNATTSDQAVAG